MEYSKTQGTNLTAIVGVIVLIASKFGFEVGPEELTGLIGAAIAIYGIVSNWINRYKRGDLTLGGFKK